MGEQPADINKYIEDLPNVLADAYSQARPGWSGNTIEMNRATYSVIEVVKKMWLTLARAFPDRHFDGQTPEGFLEKFISQRYAWHRALAEPHGPGTGGTIVSQLVNGGVLRDLETAVLDTVKAI